MGTEILMGCGILRTSLVSKTDGTAGDRWQCYLSRPPKNPYKYLKFANGPMYIEKF